jgi:hypothetical protein
MTEMGVVSLLTERDRLNLFQRLEAVDHGFHLGARVIVLGDQGGAFSHQGVLPGLQGLVFFAEVLNLRQQLVKVLFQPFQVFAGLFQGIHGDTIICGAIPVNWKSAPGRCAAANMTWRSPIGRSGDNISVHPVAVSQPARNGGAPGPLAVFGKGR